MPEIGAPFNPWRKSCGFYPPDVVAKQREFTYVDPRPDTPKQKRDRTPKQREFTDGMKRLYERGVRWAGQRGTFWYSFDTMAAELGKSLRQVKYDMEALEVAGLVGHKRRGRMQTNLYTFLWNQIFESEVQSTAHHSGGEVQNGADFPESEVQDSPSEVQWSAENGQSEVQSTALELCTSFELCKGISSSKVLSVEVEQPAIEVSHDDETHFHENGKPEDENLDALRAELETVDPFDPEAFWNDAKIELRAARIQDLYGEVTAEGRRAVNYPDRQITLEILKLWPEEESFRAWLEDTIQRRVAQKARAASWGIYLADAIREAPRIIEHVRQQRAISIDSFIEEERIAAAKRAHKALLDALTDPAGAIEQAEKERGKEIPERLKLRILRLGDMLSPTGVLNLVNQLYKCEDCTKGLQGNAIDKTLDYCSCMWGVELGYVDPDYPAREIARVHADAKSLMLRACGLLTNDPHQVGCDELCMPYIGDAIQACDITETSNAVTIKPTRRFDEIALRPDDLEKIRKRLRWTRQVRVVGSSDSGSSAVSAETDDLSTKRKPSFSEQTDDFSTKRMSSFSAETPQAVCA